jgi:hypothetical protein
LHLLFSVLFWLPFIGFSRRLGSRQILFFCFGPVSANDPFSARHRFQYQGFFCPVPQVLIFIESFIFLLPHAIRFQSTARTGLLLRVRRTRLIPKRVAHPQFGFFFRRCSANVQLRVARARPVDDSYRPCVSAPTDSCSRILQDRAQFWFVDQFCFWVPFPCVLFDLFLTAEQGRPPVSSSLGL